MIDSCIMYILQVRHPLRVVSTITAKCPRWDVVWQVLPLHCVYVSLTLKC